MLCQKVKAISARMSVICGLFVGQLPTGFLLVLSRATITSIIHNTYVDSSTAVVEVMCNASALAFPFYVTSYR